MNRPTLDSYAHARDVFVAQMAPLEEDVVALYLFGSFARGEAIAGYSDLDFCLFLNEALFDEYERFEVAMHTLMNAMTAVQGFNIPLYNFCAYHSSASLQHLPPMLVSNLTQPGNSQLLLGRDVRDQMASTAASRELTQKSTFYELRRQLYLPLLALLKKESLSNGEKMMAFGALQYIKYVPEAACAALGLWPGEAAARHTLQERFPQLDLTPVETVKRFCTTQGLTAPDSDLIAHCWSAIGLVERVNDALLAERANGK